jgi:hypothetical protein
LVVVGVGLALSFYVVVLFQLIATFINNLIFAFLLQFIIVLNFRRVEVIFHYFLSFLSEELIGCNAFKLPIFVKVLVLIVIFVVGIIE